MGFRGIKIMIVGTTIGERLADMREETGLSQEGMADKLDEYRSKIADWENDRSKYKAEDIVKLAIFFNTSCDMILRGIRPEFLDIHKNTDLSDKAIEELISFKNLDESLDSENLSLGTLLSFWLEDERAKIEFESYFKDFLKTIRRSQKFSLAKLIQKKRSKKVDEEHESFTKWADSNGFIFFGPEEAVNHYLHRMAESFVDAIESRIVGTEEERHAVFLEAMKLYNLENRNTEENAEKEV
jgi:transcriptional regulator with XRE-family HTH domain